jgi:drug/metabolite transporter (DMT)-like permease
MNATRIDQAKTNQIQTVQTQANPKLNAILQLVLVTILWGGTLPLSAIASHGLNPSLPLAARFVIASLPLLRCLCNLNREILRDGIILGGLRFLTYLGQMMALQTGSVNRTAILSAMNIVIVPVLLKLLGRKVSAQTFLFAALALTGAFAMKPDMDLTHWAISDLWALSSAFAFAILTIKLEACASRHDGLKLTAVQLCTIAVISSVMAVPNLGQLQTVIGDLNWLASVLYLGLGATLATTLLQVRAQRHVTSSQSSAILGLEPVTTAGFAWGLLAQVPSTNEITGGLLVMLAGALMDAPIQLPAVKPNRTVRLMLAGLLMRTPMPIPVMARARAARFVLMARSV